jgi:hypothetical protein
VPGDPERQRDLAAVVRAVAGAPADLALGGLLSRAVAGGLEAGPDVVGCSITERDGSGFRTTVYSGAPSMALDLVQYQAGRGPCLSALLEQRSYLADAAELGALVPGWAQVATREGVASVLSLPLPGLRRPAGINFYGASAAGFRLPVVAARAALVGRLAGLLLQQQQGGTAAGGDNLGPAAAGPAAERQRALLARAREAVSRAEGISGTEAFARLAQRSLREQRSIGAIARDIIDDQRSSGRKEP